MKTVLKWASLIFAIIVVGFSLYALICLAGIEREPWLHPDVIPIVMVLLVAMSVGAIFLCVGAFKRNKTLAMIGIVIFICVVVCSIFTYRMGIAYSERYYYERYFNR